MGLGQSLYKTNKTDPQSTSSQMNAFASHSHEQL